MVQASSVQLRGWDYPHIDRNHDPHVDIDWVGQETDWEHFRELWRFYQSGQFFSLCAFEDDWRDRSTVWPPGPNWGWGQTLGIGATLARFTEFFEFAARLSMTAAGDESMHVEILAGNIAGRVLAVDSPSRGWLRSQPTAGITEFPYRTEIRRSDLVTNPRQSALEGAMELFKRFGWEGQIDVLRGWQDELVRR
jgi:hypothetical protein